MSKKLISTWNFTRTGITFFDGLDGKNSKSQKSFIFFAYWNSLLHDFDFEKSKTPPAGQLFQSQSQNKKKRVPSNSQSKMQRENFDVNKVKKSISFFIVWSLQNDDKRKLR